MRYYDFFFSIKNTSVDVLSFLDRFLSMWVSYLT